jgi:8-oxoguanine deaminase
MLSGCTTTSDHHYVFPRGIPNLMDAEFEAAEAMGIRFHGCRGCMDIPSEFDPPTLIQTTDEILNDYQRVLERWHDPSPGSMRQVAFAPSGILCSTPDLLRETARMGQKYKIRLHIHCGETKEEQQRSLAKFGSRPLQYLAEAGWSEDNVWLAHGIHFDDKEVGFLNQHGIGIAHCPCSNMRLGSGVCRVTELRGGGSPVSLGVDGSASNDSGHMLNEVRQALLLNRVIYGASSMRVEEALEMATLEGARNLGRSNEIGSVEVGKCADLAIFPANDLFSNGAENVVHSLVLCFPRKVETLVINGKVRVRDGELLGTDLPDLLRCHAAAANRLHQQ